MNNGPIVTIPLAKCYDSDVTRYAPEPDPPEVAAVKIRHAGETAEMEERQRQERLNLFKKHREEMEAVDPKNQIT